MWKEIKNDKLKSIVIVLGIIVFVVGIVSVTFIISNSYALTDIEDVNSCYYCASSNTYEWTSSPSTSCPGGISWTKKDEIKDSASCVKPVTYTITFDTDGGNSIIDKYVSEGNSFTAPTATKSGGYVFKYWRDTFRGTQYTAGQTITPTSSMTLVAVYDKYSCYACYTNNEYKWATSTPSTSCSGGESWKVVSGVTSESKCTAPKTYTITFDTDGGNNIIDKYVSEGNSFTAPTPVKDGYSFQYWRDTFRGVQYTAGQTITPTSSMTLLAVWVKDDISDSGNTGSGDSGNTGSGDSGNTEPTEISYNIEYKLNGGTVTGNPSGGKYGEVLTINNPSKTVTVTVNDNKMDATIGEAEKVNIVFEGWTSSDINTDTAYYDSQKWSDGDTKVTATKFRNLTDIDGGTVTLVANWQDKNITLPTVVKHGYNCSINTKADGSGEEYTSGGKYTIKANSSNSINLYAICEEYSKTDEDIDKNSQTGDALIYTVWVVGLGALGYSVYYFMRRKNSL